MFHYGFKSLHFFFGTQLGMVFADDAQLFGETELFRRTNVAAFQVALQTTHDHVAFVVPHPVVDSVQRPLLFVVRFVQRFHRF